MNDIFPRAKLMTKMHQYKPRMMTQKLFVKFCVNYLLIGDFQHLIAVLKYVVYIVSIVSAWNLDESLWFFLVRWQAHDRRMDSCNTVLAFSSISVFCCQPENERH